MQIRDRILDFRRVRADQLRPNPRNWRTHPVAQQEAMRGMLAEIGYADALLVRELDDGSFELIDGHLRAELTPTAEMPVLILDLDEEEAAKLLTLHDPLAAMAGTDQNLLDELLAEVDTKNEALRAELDQLAQADGISLPDHSLAEVPIPQLYQIIIECTDEEDQRRLYEQLTAENRKCRLVNL